MEKSGMQENEFLVDGQAKVVTLKEELAPMIVEAKAQRYARHKVQWCTCETHRGGPPPFFFLTGNPH
jgi:hypothetical protein